ncbi:HAD hydrolase-like protein [Desulfonatronum parangueonense]
MELSNYKTLICDCDGVVLNSNKVKTQAFYNTALPYGQESAETLRNYHINHGGVSRYKKFEYFLTDILGIGIDQHTLETLLNGFAREVKKGLMACEVAEGLHDLRDKTKQARWMIVSGGDQEELRNVFEHRGLSDLFDGGIYGSPDDKIDILKREIGRSNIVRPALYIGDSKYDHQAANNSGIDFIFVSGWSEFSGWQDYCSKERLLCVQHLKDIFTCNAE